MIDPTAVGQWLKKHPQSRGASMSIDDFAGVCIAVSELVDKRPSPSIPPGMKLFSSVTAVQPDGARYCIEFLARDFADAERLCKMMGLSTEINELGESIAIIEMTPDGPLTIWDIDEAGEAKPDGGGA